MRDYVILIVQALNILAKVTMTGMIFLQFMLSSLYLSLV